MASINVFTGVGRLAGVTGMTRTHHVAAAAHPAFIARTAAAAIAPPRKRRAAVATAPSVDRGPI